LAEVSRRGTPPGGPNGAGTETDGLVALIATPPPRVWAAIRCLVSTKTYVRALREGVRQSSSSSRLPFRMFRTLTFDLRSTTLGLVTMEFSAP
jgi:hypothetical protein